MLAALQVRALLVLVGVVLIPYERTRIEVLAAACLCDTDTLRTNLYRSACWCLLLPTALQVRACWCLVACYWCLLHYRPCLLVLACVVLIPYERTCIEVLAGAWLRFFGFWVSILL